MRQDKMERCLPSFFSSSLSFPSSRSKSNSKVVEGNKISPTLQREAEVSEGLRVLPWCTMDAHGHSHSLPWRGSACYSSFDGQLLSNKSGR